MISRHLGQVLFVASASLVGVPWVVADVVIVPTTMAAAWTGGAADPQMKHGGAESLRWEPAQSPMLSLRPVTSDFSVAGTFLVWIHANHASGDWLNVAVKTRGNHPQTEEADSVSCQVQITWTGWQEILLPRRAFESAPGKHRTNWRDAQRVEFSFPEHSAPDLVIHLGDFRLGDPMGLRLSDGELLNLIDLSRRDLSEVSQRAAEGDVSAAIKALAKYYRQRRTVKWWIDPDAKDSASVKPNMKRANDAVAGYLTILNRRFPFGGKVADWSLNPTAGLSDQTDEWLWSLNRMGYWTDLSDAWWKTGDSKYAEVWVRQLRSWAEAMPRPSLMDEAPGSGWRGLEAGIRVTESWPHAWFRFLSAPEFTDADLILMLKCFAEHGRYLEEHRVPNPQLPASNHYLLAWSGLYTVGTLFPELKSASQWRADGADRLSGALRAGLLSDGGWYEFAPGYHLWVLEKALDAYRLAKLEGDEKSFPAAFHQMLQRGYEWPVKLMAPDLTLPRVNDTGADERMAYGPELAQLFPESSLLRWAVSLTHPDASRSPIAPPPWHSVFLESSGYAVMRSGWSKTDTYACFDVGQLGGWHGHQDKLSLLIWARGRELLFDGGGGTYDESAFRKYGQQTESHNTVMVDGLNQNRHFIPYVDPIGLDDPATPAPVFETQADWDYASGWYVGGYGPEEKHVARHRREVAVLHGGMFLVNDTLTPSDDGSHEYQARWHLKTTHWSHEKLISGSVTADAGATNLVIVPLETSGLTVNEDSAVLTPKLLGWEVARDRKPAPALTIRHTKAGQGVKHFVTLILPLAANERNPIRTVQRESETHWTVLFDEGRKLAVEIAAFDGSGFKVTETNSAGESSEYSVRAR